MPPELTHISQAQESLRQQANWLKTCPEECVPDAYHGLMRCAEQLFQMEQALMEAYDFPSRRTHLELHARVLHGLHCVHGAVLNGQCSQGRHTGGSLLLDWLALHQDTVDAVLAVWIDYCKQGPRDPSAPGRQGQIKAP